LDHRSRLIMIGTAPRERRERWTRQNGNGTGMAGAEP